MADDLNPVVTGEVEAHLASIEPEIRGLEDLVRIGPPSISPPLESVLQAELEKKVRRAGLARAFLVQKDAAVAALQALMDDGYPALDTEAIDPALFSELQGEDSDLDKAIKLFKAQQASAIAFTFGAAEPKPAP